jgi:hypothetical protein
MIPRPASKDDRKKFYKGKPPIGWGLKIQLSVGLDGQIWHTTSGVPSSTSDPTIFDASSLPGLLEDHKVLGVGDSHYVRCAGMVGRRAGKRQEIEYKDYNKEIGPVRAIVENVNARLKQWAIFRDTYRLDRHDIPMFDNFVSTVCGLINVELPLHPLRSDKRSIQPKVRSKRKKSAAAATKSKRQKTR